MQVKRISFSQSEELASLNNVVIPIEQTEVWSKYQSTIPGRSQWATILVSDQDRPICFTNFLDFQTHGYHFLRSMHGPVWFGERTADLEQRVVDAIVSFVKLEDSKIAFIRMAVDNEVEGSEYVLSTTPYDTTVLVDVTGGDEEILARMKPRGRRDVRKAIREAPINVADETDKACENFEEYYKVMQVTGERDGFVPAPMSDYVDMLSLLGKDHTRLYAAREKENNKVVAWSIYTVNCNVGVRYYAASSSEFRSVCRNFNDELTYFELCEMGRMGCEFVDMMAIGSDFSPELLGLNEFKTKFTKEVAHVAPDRDIVVKPVFYSALKLAKKQIDKKRQAQELKEQNAPREDLLPVVVGGDIGAYALMRQFHEAYHTQSICIAPSPIAAIKYSKIAHLMSVESITQENLVEKLLEISNSNPDKKIFVIGNTDSIVMTINKAMDVIDEIEAVDNIYHSNPSQETIDLISDKNSFNEFCQNVGIDVPETEYIDLSKYDEIQPTKISFPLIAKPSVSAEFDSYYAKGFKKVYFMHTQEELDTLWSDLKEAGFEGGFLVQELIEGDDTYMDSVTCYCDTKGKITLFASAHVLLEDHAPTMLGNPVAMVTEQQKDNWKKVESLLEQIDYHGFCNFDIKRDPKSGRSLFLDMNPRIGRNSYYVAAAGVNPMMFCVSDIVDKRTGRVFKAKDQILYTVVPLDLVKKYVDEPTLQLIEDLQKQDKVFDPQRYSKDVSLRRNVMLGLVDSNHFRKFKQYYPKVTNTSF